MPLVRTVLGPVAACCLVAAALAGCSPAARPGSKGEVVEIEAIESVASENVAEKGIHKGIDAAAATSKKIVDDATAAADRAIAAAGSTIDSDARVADRKADAVMPKPAEEITAKPASNDTAKPAAATSGPSTTVPGHQRAPCLRYQTRLPGGSAARSRA
jgi:hypothetical protein